MTGAVDNLGEHTAPMQPIANAVAGLGEFSAQAGMNSAPNPQRGREEKRR